MWLSLELLHKELASVYLSNLFRYFHSRNTYSLVMMIKVLVLVLDSMEFILAKLKKMSGELIVAINFVDEKKELKYQPLMADCIIVR